MVFTLVDKVAEKQPAISTTKKPLTQLTKTPVYKVWHYGLWSFQVGGTRLERFLSKNQQNQRNFENWVNGEVSKRAKI
jgi:hypothetical protein